MPLLSGIALLLIIFLGIIIRDKAVPVEIVKVVAGDIQATVTASGYIDSLEREIIVAKIDGTISKLKVTEGEHVKKGHVLCVIKNPEIKSKKIQAEINLSLAEENLRMAESKEEIRAAKARYELSKENLSYLKSLIEISPGINGEVIDVKVKEGQPAASGIELFKIADMDRVILRARVNEFDADKVKVGQSVKIRGTMFKDVEFKGHVYKADLFIGREKEMAYMEILCTIEKVKEFPLRLGAFAEADIVVEERKDVLRIPKEALLLEDDQNWVFVVRRGRAFSRLIQVGLSSEEDIEVVSGLKEGEEVVIMGKFELNDGDRIKIEKRL